MAKELNFDLLFGGLSGFLLLVGLTLVVAGFGSIFGVPILSAGNVAGGYLAAGNVSLGVFAAGIFSVGVFAIGIFSVGIFSIGLFNIGIFVVGIYALGIYRAPSPIAPARTSESE